jgi:hypothetical protein
MCNLTFSLFIQDDILSKEWRLLAAMPKDSIVLFLARSQATAEPILPVPPNTRAFILLVPSTRKSNELNITDSPKLMKKNLSHRIFQEQEKAN